MKPLSQRIFEKQQERGIVTSNEALGMIIDEVDQITDRFNIQKQDIKKDIIEDIKKNLVIDFGLMVQQIVKNELSKKTKRKP